MHLSCFLNVCRESVFRRWGQEIFMARTNPRDVLADGEFQVVHGINYCVRRAYLCG